MLSVTDTEKIIFDLVQPFTPDKDTEIIDLFSASNRILASAITSQLDFPHWDNSAMDGYAVRYADVQECSAENPAVLQIVAEIPAGYQPQSSIQPGQAARIFTGAIIPPGADTVIMQERTRQEGNQVYILASPRPQEFVRKRASYYQAGQELLPTGIPIKATEMAILAAAQCIKIPVYRRPKVAIFSTGDELVTPEQPLQPGQIVDSNGYVLAALVQEMGAQVLPFGIIKDEPEALTAVISQAISQADIVISSGGVSVGEYDYVEQVIKSLGGEVSVASVAMKPGKPLTVANFSQKQSLYFGLPGNPVSALVTFWRFVQPAIRKLSGLADGWRSQFLLAKTVQELRSDGKRESYIWGRLHLVDGKYEFHLSQGSQVSGNLINLAQTNALAVMKIGENFIAQGEEVWVIIP
ncbi:molybdopterin molybdotransferase MoeA [Calothrix sp. 336/3]|uniref:molybdopterin molybdotransferase MoeA n=1 Tax=Calothrix sp. 336/3 TaxID=1337936 RepID=UPI0004E3ED6A|nr:gephyrin-like molybdotransferase Glp [Calothrix sp. 336/3]AKG21737.1 molybdopterin molybdenumtransferase [Calothrix sp. 336/3]